VFGSRRWRATELLWSWCAYWVVLGVVALGPGLLAAWRVTRPGTGHGNVSVSFGNGVLQASVTNTAKGAAAVWTGSTSLTTALLWIAVPPLVLWVLWLASRPRPVVSEPGAPDALPAAPPESFADPKRTEIDRVNRAP
jgi:hypothetical protein